MNVGGPLATSTDSAVLAISAGPIVTPVLGRVIGIFAARAELSVDRLNDAVLIGDAIAASGALHRTAQRIRVGIEASHRRLVLCVGPLVEGGGERLLEASDVPGIDGILSRLADEVEVRPTADGDVVHLALIET